MKDARRGDPPPHEGVDPLPRGPVLLAAPPQRASPDGPDVEAEGREAVRVVRHGMVVEPAADHLLEPSPVLVDRLVPSSHELLLDLPQLGPHAVAPALAS